MSTQIPVEFVEAYRANILWLSQQKVSKLRQTCRMEPFTGDALFVERIGATAMVEIADRHGDTPQIDTPHSRRKLTLTDYDWSDKIDEMDKLKLIADPESTYVKNAVAAANRTIDDTIITALGGASLSGRAGATTVNFYDVGESRLIESSGVIVTAGSDWSDTTETPLTIAKLLTCKQLLDDAEIDEERQRYFVTNPFNINQMLNTTEVKSSDYNTVKALAMGQLDTFMGFKFIRSTRLNADDTDTGATQCFAFAQDSIVLSINKEPFVSVDRLPTKRYTTQIYVRESLGATRVEGPAVVGITLKTT